MKPLARIALLAATPLFLVVSLDILSSTPAAAPKAQDVSVVNPSIPVTGTVAATESGPWSVTLDGTPTVNVASLPAAGVNVTNPQDPNSLGPVPLVTRDAGDKQPLSYAGVATFNPGDTQIVVDMGTVPTDRAFVAEFLSARMSLPTPERVFLILFPDVQHNFAPTFVGADSGNDVAILSQPIHFSYSSASLVRFTATRLNSIDGSGFVSVGLSGYSVKP